MMRHIYGLIREYKEKGACMLATVVSGSCAGEKWLFCAGEPVPGQTPSPFLVKHMEALQAVTETSLVTVEGMDLFCECFGAQPQMVLCGAGTVGLALIPLAKTIGFSVTVLEDRQEFAQRAQKQGADTVLTAPFVEGLAEVEGNAQTYYVVMTREHQYDLQCLKSILEKPGIYVGMMGSRRRVAILKEQLRSQLLENASALERLEKLHAPIGLAISAQTPEEIAVSVAAELIQCRNKARTTQGYDEKLLDAILHEGHCPAGNAKMSGNIKPEVNEGTDEVSQSDERLRSDDYSDSCVLAMIIERNGAAPRDIGTKMVIREDGSIIGTIGGGPMEGRVIARAREMLAGTQKRELIRDELDGESGVLCGGTLLIYLEVNK